MSVTAALTLTPSTIKSGQRSTATIVVTSDSIDPIVVERVAVSAPPGSALLIGDGPPDPSTAVGAATAAVAATGSYSLSGAYGQVTATIEGYGVSVYASQLVGGTIDIYGASVRWAATDTNSATLIAAAMNADVGIAALLVALAAANVVGLTALLTGTAGNSIALSAIGAAGGVTASGAHLSGGVDAVNAQGKVTIPGADPGGNVTVTIEDVPFTVLWAVSASATAIALADAIQTAIDTNTPPGFNAILAGADGGAFAGKVLLGAYAGSDPSSGNSNGAAGNSITLVATLNCTVSGATLGTGVGIQVGVDGVAATGTLTLSDARGTTDTDVATALAAAIVADNHAGALVDAAGVGTSVNLTALVEGAVGNALTTTATGSGLTANQAHITGGADGFFTISIPVQITSLAPPYGSAEFTKSIGAQVTLDDGTQVPVTPATLTLDPVQTVPIAPYITSQPAAASVAAGHSATFSVTAAGDGPLSYQWFVGLQTIPGATSSSYSTGTLPRSSTGLRFSVVVTGAAGVVTSAQAALTVTA